MMSDERRERSDYKDQRRKALKKPHTALADENADLRAELASSKAAHRAVWKLHQARGQRIFDLQDENARLRAELEEMREYLRKLEKEPDE